MTDAREPASHAHAPSSPPPPVGAPPPPPASSPTSAPRLSPRTASPTSPTLSPAAPWRPSSAQGRLLAACLALPGDRGPLADWCRRHAADVDEPGVAELLPFAFDALLAVAPPESALVRQARALTLDTARLNLARLAKLRAAVRQLEAAGMPSLALKGAALTVAAYRRYGVRAMADVDLLVRSADAARAIVLLTASGWSAPGDHAPASTVARMRLQHARAFTAGPLHGLDLHWRLFNGCPPGLEDRLWEGAEEAEVEGLRLRMPDPSAQLFHLCVHAVQPQWRSSARWLLDAAMLFDRHGARIDWSAIIDFARQTRTMARLRAAVAELRAWLPGRMPGSVVSMVEALPVSGWERRELALFLRPLPFAGPDALRWHWCQFHRLRAADARWSRWPAAAGFADYVRLKQQLRRRDRAVTRG